MEPKTFTLINQGMNRDLSISKTDKSSAYENVNIRITARENDTLLSVTNERGNKEIDLGTSILGVILGWNVLKEHIILFSHYTEAGQDLDLIYRIDYNYTDGSFAFVGNMGPEHNCLYAGNLGFHVDYPIESVVYFETEEIQKIYWVDGKNVLRFMNFMAPECEPDVYSTWNDTSFDSNRIANFDVKVKITKDNSGNSRPNGVAQYLITYFNKHGQETGYVWLSDIVYLSPKDRGGASDETNNNNITLTISNLDTSFSYFRVYSIFRTSLNGETTAYLVSEQKTTNNDIIIVDDGAHLVLQDASRLLYLGSQAVCAGTIEHKDQTLFLGDLKSIGRSDYNDLEEVLRSSMFGVYDNDVIRHSQFEDGVTYMSCRIHFEYSGDIAQHDELASIPLPDEEGNYPYSNQLQLTSSEILTFKGGEKYRFALKFKCADGTETDAFWIGDAVNDKYPIMDNVNKTIKRVIAVCKIPDSVVSFLQNSPMKYRTIQLLIAEATYADRSVKAQGIVSPTMFNVWERFNHRVYSVPSWVTRIRNSNLAWQHFSPVKNSSSSDGEIQCNYWEGVDEKKPFYQYSSYNISPSYTETFEGKARFSDIMLLYHMNYWVKWHAFVEEYVYTVRVYVIKGISYGSFESQLKSHSFTEEEWNEKFNDYASSTSEDDKSGWQFLDVRDSNDNLLYTIERKDLEFKYSVVYNHGSARNGVYSKMYNYLTQTLGISHNYIVDRAHFITWCKNTRKDGAAFYNDQFPDDRCSTILDALNLRNNSQARWQSEGDYNPGANYGDKTPAFFKKHLMFVDENVVTLDSPELALDAVSLDNTQYKFRIVGAAIQSSVLSDYTIDASNSAVAGTNYDKESFSGNLSTRHNMLDGLSAWPLWRDYGLTMNDDARKREANSSLDELDKLRLRSSSDYIQGKNVIRYWMYLWQHSGNISGYFSTEEESAEIKSILKSKTIANQRNAFNTIFFDNPYTYPTIDSIRQVHEYSNSEVLMTIGSEQQYYSSSPRLSLSLPADHKYPIIYSSVRPEQTTDTLNGMSDSPYLFSSAPVMLEYNTQGHAIISLHTDDSNSGAYVQDILPKLFDSETITIPEKDMQAKITGALIPWLKDKNRYNYGIVSNAQIPTFTEEEYIEGSSVVTLRADFNSEQSLHRKDPDFFTAWQALIDSFGGEDVYTFVESSLYVYFVKINSVERTETDPDTNHFSIYLQNVDCVSRILKQEPSGDSVLIDVHTAVITNPYLDEEAEVDVAASLSGSVNLRTKAMTYNNYHFRDYNVNQPDLTDISTNSSLARGLKAGDRYFFIGEIYKDFGTGNTDVRYGGISLSSVKTNRFIAAGPSYLIEEMAGDNTDEIFGNQGDTYFQRWDSMHTKPVSNEAPNRVIDITSCMLETHINLDGRTDLQRGISEIASVDVAQYGSLNPVYSQMNNFILKRDLDEDFNTDAYRSSITWTLPKTDMSDVDEWTHITLGSTLKLDGDKGICRAIRRIQNNLIAFQDRGISELLYNSRTSLSTQEGVPIEIANSGKVDGKRYITNKYGCTNKWSIVEGKAGMYFIDSNNKLFASINVDDRGRYGVTPLSDKLGFSAWFRSNSFIEPWSPINNAESIVSFYDKVHSDIYLVKTDETDQPCLVFNENLGVFTSFLSYGNVPMMANVDDKFVAFKNGHLWLQNEGLYCNFFGEQKDFWVQYRVAPNPYTDKIWTNVDYRADFYRTLDAEGNSLIDRDESLYNLDEWAYRKDETFDVLRVWNEYQNTGENKTRPIKKFRIWRYIIPRALPCGTNIYGLDRIRNPWINILFKKKYDDDGNSNQDMMQLHDITITYFE